MPQLEAIDFQSETYKDAYSRINAIVIEGEQEACDNYVRLADLLPEHKDELTKLAQMESRHKKGFTACGKNLNVTPDLDFAQNYFSQLRNNFKTAADNKDVVTCLLIQALIIEAFAIAAYNIYIPVADDFARKITENVVADEYSHINFGEKWLKENFESSEATLKAANRLNLPIVWQMLDQVTEDAKVLGMEKSALIEDFTIQYSEALGNIGFSARETVGMMAAGLMATA